MRSYNLISKILPLKALLVDADGVMTCGGIFRCNSGDELKRFDVKDGLALYALRKFGMRVGIITGKNSELMKQRAKELRIEDLYQSFPVKMPAFEDFIGKHDLQPSEVAFVGDDVIDIPLMDACGFAICPSNAAHIVMNHADWITRASGGDGALREIVEMILAAKLGQYPPNKFLLDWASGIDD